ncbi:MAG: hypothetical protein EA391_00835 [Balneolaceae bacterium]|nr:MAG: hypothetical protein EA391_00835 [Balneolaceae bacterium]
MNGIKNLVANFERSEYTITIEKVGEGSVTKELISGTQTDNGYLFESSVKLTATPKKNWNFLRWEGDVESDSQSFGKVINDHITIRAVFIEFEDGDGSEDNPYQVANLHQLQRVGSYLDRHFIQVSDIDASKTQGWNPEVEFTPIGIWIDEHVNDAFSGTYNGQGFEIKDLSIRNRDDIIGRASGLFGYVNESGLIKNLTIQNLSLDIYYSDDFSSMHVGTFIGLNHGKISSVLIKGIRGFNFNFLGGVVGTNYGEIVKVHSEVIFGGEDMGGIPDLNYGNIYNSSFIGNIRGFGGMESRFWTKTKFICCLCGVKL